MLLNVGATGTNANMNYTTFTNGVYSALNSATPSEGVGMWSDNLGNGMIGALYNNTASSLNLVVRASSSVSGLIALKLSGNGAATFSSSITAVGATFSGTTALASAAGTSQMRIDRSGTVARIQNYDNGSAANISLAYDGGNVLVGTTTDAGQKLQVNGITKTNGISLAKTSFSSSTTLTDAFFSWSFGGGTGQTLTLYDSSGHTNMHFIKNESSISLTIAAHSGGVIMPLTSNSGSSSITLAAFKTVQIISFGGGAWYIMYQTS
jgi:hypothetical protein